MNTYEKALEAYAEYQDGKKWLMINSSDGYAWQEPMTDWTYIIDLVYGKDVYRNKDGIEIKAG